jgi:hypothetical protein
LHFLLNRVSLLLGSSLHSLLVVQLVLFFLLLLLALYRPRLGFLEPFVGVVLEKGEEKV